MARPELPVISFIALALVCIPIPWHWRARNIATLSTIFWLALGNLYDGINSIVWARDVSIKYSVYCDIGGFLYVASACGLPAAAVCITRHLESVSSPRYSVSGLNDKKYRRIFELFMCFGLPIIYAGIHMIVQGHRFDIVEQIGCIPTTYMSWPAIFLFYVPPMILAIITSFYAGMSLRWFMQRRAQFRDILSSTNSGLTTARYFRLMGLALCEMVGSFAICLYIIIVAVKGNAIQPWVGWDWVHAGFGRIGQFPAVLIPAEEYSRLFGAWAIIPASSVCFFLFFGFGEEALAEYKKYGRFIVSVVTWKSRPRNDAHTLPSYMTRSDAGTSKVEMSGMSTSTRHSDIESKWDDTDLGSIIDSRIDLEDAKEYPYNFHPQPQPSHPAPRRDGDHQIVISLSRRPSIDVDVSPPPSIYVNQSNERRLDF